MFRLPDYINKINNVPKTTSEVEKMFSYNTQTYDAPHTPQTHTPQPTPTQALLTQQITHPICSQHLFRLLHLTHVRSPYKTHSISTIKQQWIFQPAKRADIMNFNGAHPIYAHSNIPASGDRSIQSVPRNTGVHPTAKGSISRPSTN